MKKSELFVIFKDHFWLNFTTVGWLRGLSKSGKEPHTHTSIMEQKKFETTTPRFVGRDGGGIFFKGHYEFDPNILYTQDCCFAANIDEFRRWPRTQHPYWWKHQTVVLRGQVCWSFRFVNQRLGQSHSPCQHLRHEDRRKWILFRRMKKYIIYKGFRSRDREEWKRIGRFEIGFRRRICFRKEGWRNEFKRRKYCDPDIRRILIEKAQIINSHVVIKLVLWLN